MISVENRDSSTIESIHNYQDIKISVIGTNVILKGNGFEYSFPEDSIEQINGNNLTGTPARVADGLRDALLTTV